MASAALSATRTGRATYRMYALPFRTTQTVVDSLGRIPIFEGGIWRAPVEVEPAWRRAKMQCNQYNGTCIRST